MTNLQTVAAVVGVAVILLGLGVQVMTWFVLKMETSAAFKEFVMSVAHDVANDGKK
jgi:hypothetical protein